MNKNTQSGSHVVLAILLVVGLLVAIGFTFYTAVLKNKDDKSENTVKVEPKKSVNPNEPDLKLKSIGVNLGNYDPKTNRAGDFLFTKENISQYGNLIFMDYAKVEIANEVDTAGGMSPQASFIVPLGTPIRSLVDGVVTRVPKLYSGDYSIHVASSMESQWVYETEHVIDPTVKVGDKVKAGQVIAKPSDYNSHHHPGFGLYEIGILHAGNPPAHVCPFNYLDDSIKNDVQAKMRAFYKSWEAYMGDDKLYDEAKMVVPGCYSLDKITDNNKGAQ